MNRDTDRDGKEDGSEIIAGSDPLKSSAKGENDDIVFESPKEKGVLKNDVYKVESIGFADSSTDGKKTIEIKRKGTR